MIGRRAVLGLSMLSALLFCAFAAQSASAEKGENTTGFTCVKDPEKKGDFTDAHCDKTGTKGASEFAHQSIANGVTAEYEVTNDKMGAGTNEKTSQLLKATAFSVKVEITCDTAKGTGEIHNVETAGKHTVTGKGTLELSGCKALKPAKCTVKEPVLISEGTLQGVEGLGAGKNEMGTELAPKEGSTTFAEMTLEGAECVGKGKPFKVEGTAIGTSNPAVGNTAKEGGATVTFTEAMTKETLKVGISPAEFKGGFTIKLKEKEGKPQNPIVATTTT